MREETKKYQYIDILRGVAILGVLAVHSHQGIPGLSAITSAVFNYGQLGVQLFFIASALTLCLSASQRHEKSPVKFYLRRFFRIAPLYYFGILIYFAWRVMAGAQKTGEIAIPQSYTWLAVLENIIFTHSLNPSSFNYIVPGGWSISVEMIFYAFFPVVWHYTKKLGKAQLISTTIAIAVVSLSIQYLIITSQPQLKNNEFGFLYASPINQITVFMIGVVTFRLISSKISSRQIITAIALIVAGVIIQNDRSYDTGLDGFIYITLSSVGFSILIIKLSQLPMHRGIITDYLARVGQNSYSMYLMHFIVLDIVRLFFQVVIRNHNPSLTPPEILLLLMFFILVSITYLASMLTKKYIETPGIKLGNGLIRNYFQKKSIEK